MTSDDVLEEFRAAGALLEGHFILSSGLHSPVFLQKTKVFEDPVRTERLCRALAEKVRATLNDDVDLVASPAVGGIIPGYETARALGVHAIFTEREKGEFALRRGFEIPDGARVLMVEDIVTTGLSSRECIACLKAAGANVVAEACIVDRSGGEADVGAPLISLAQVKFPAYPADALPDELAAMPAVKPGSRHLTA
ncbi:MAG: orotate phosphoribosyltransferase [Maricaulaceae bacterium]|jgi:orotate phosphoribosyltransferase